MKRLALSILCGVAFPLAYVIVTGPLSTYIQDRRLQLLLDVPTGWPRLLCFYLSPPFFRDLMVDNETAFFLYIIGCDVLFYTLVTYFVLLAFSFKRLAIKENSPPPPPDVL